MLNEVRVPVILYILIAGCNNHTNHDDTCLNGVLDINEICDPSVVETEPCITDCDTEGTRLCNWTCNWEECIAIEVCGNDIDEDCDGEYSEYALSADLTVVEDLFNARMVYKDDRYMLVGADVNDSEIDIEIFGYVFNSNFIIIEERNNLRSNEIGSANYPQISTNESKVIVVWEDDREEGLPEGHTQVYGNIYNSALIHAGDDIKISNSLVDILNPRVVPLDSGFSIVWIEDTVNYCRSDSSLLEIDSIKDVSESVEGERGFNLTALDSGDGIDIFWNDGLYNKLNKLSYDGMVVNAYNILGTGINGIAVPLSNGYGYIWSEIRSSEDSDVFIRILDENGENIGPIIDISDNTDFSYGPVAISDNNNIAVAYETDTRQIAEETLEYTIYETTHDISMLILNYFNQEVVQRINLGSYYTRMISYTGGDPPSRYLSVFKLEQLLETDDGYIIVITYGNSEEPDTQIMKVICVP